jgi:hypothetical protein
LQRSVERVCAASPFGETTIESAVTAAVAACTPQS